MTRKVLVFAAIVFASFEIFACAAVTQKGTQCKRAPVPGSQYCWQYGGRSSSTASADTGWYTLTSAGTDKVFGTEDDISLSYEKQ